MQQKTPYLFYFATNLSYNDFFVDILKTPKFVIMRVQFYIVIEYLCKSSGG